MEVSYIQHLWASIVGMEISLRAGRSRVRIPTRELFFSSSQRPQWRWVPQEYRNPYPGKRRQGRDLTNHLYLTHSLRKSGATPLPLHPIHNFMTWSETNAHWYEYFCCYGPGSSVGIATDYVLGGPGIESRWGEIFRTSPYRPWGPPIILYNGYRVFPGGKVRRATDHSPPSSAMVMEE
jgi:hypothetical protein